MMRFNQNVIISRQINHLIRTCCMFSLDLTSIKCEEAQGLLKFISQAEAGMVAMVQLERREDGATLARS